MWNCSKIWDRIWDIPIPVTSDAFDPRRDAVLLIGGDKTGDKRFYERMIPIADRLYDKHLREIGDENG